MVLWLKDLNYKSLCSGHRIEELFSGSQHAETYIDKIEKGWLCNCSVTRSKPKVLLRSRIRISRFTKWPEGCGMKFTVRRLSLIPISFLLVWCFILICNMKCAMLMLLCKTRKRQKQLCIITISITMSLRLLISHPIDLEGGCRLHFWPEKRRWLKPMVVEAGWGWKSGRDFCCRCDCGLLSGFPNRRLGQRSEPSERERGGVGWQKRAIA